MLKKFKMLIELVAQTETEHGAIGIRESGEMLIDFGKVAKKHGFDCYAKGYPKEVIDYIPTGETYEIKTVEDIAKLTPEQFEMLVEDLRGWCNFTRELQPLIDAGIAKSYEGMTWIDTGLHEEKVNVEFSIGNKL